MVISETGEPILNKIFCVPLSRVLAMIIYIIRISQSKDKKRLYFRATSIWPSGSMARGLREPPIQRSIRGRGRCMSVSGLGVFGLHSIIPDICPQHSRLYDEL